MVRLQKDLKKIEAAGIRVVGISYDSVDILKKFSDAQKIEFPLLSDPKSRTIDDYRVRNTNVRSPRQQGIPYPTTFVVDKDGIIRAKLPGTTRKRHTTDQLLEAVAKMKGET